MVNIDRFKSVWVGKNLPKQHLIIAFDKVDAKGRTRLYLRKGLIHPIKRKLAKYYLVLLKKVFGLRVIAITGSAGKTSTKEMLTSVLGLGGKTVSSFKNIDPVYNIPTTILRCTPFTKYLILEMGVEFPGEMGFYLWLAKPDVGIVTNIYPTHLEFFGNIDGVFAEKSKLVKSLEANAVSVLNYEDSYLRKIKVDSKVIWFGSGGNVSAGKIHLGDTKSSFELHYRGEKVQVDLPIFGRHFIDNALSAAAGAIALGIDLQTISRGLSKFKSAEHRMNVITFRDGVRVFDDSYNNNPQAAISTIENFMQLDLGKKKVIIFGDMLELGKDKIMYHEQIGKLLSKYKIEMLICVGELSKYVGAKSKVSKVFYSNDIGEILRILKKNVIRNTDILIKGSRFVHLDLLVGKLRF